MQNKKILIFLAVIILGGLIVLGVSRQNNTVSNQSAAQNQQTPTNTNPQSTDKPQIISTKPDPLENSIVSATEVIEISFNRPLENVGEFKLRVEPKIDLKIELSSDRKTAKIKPVKPLELGASYTLSIGSDTKFDGVGAWGQEKIFHFRTIQYRGV